MAALLLVLAAVFGASTSYSQLSKPVGLVKGEVRNSSGAPVEGVVIQTYKGGEKINTTKSTPEGKFQIILQPNTEYHLIFSSPSYYTLDQPVSVPTLEKTQDIPVSATIRPLELGSPYPFKAPVFEPKSSTVSPAVTTDLDNIAAQIKRNGKLRLAVTVYPDEMPSGKKMAVQTDLANSRKNAIAGYFLAKGINNNLVSVTVSNSVPSGKFDRTVTEDAAPEPKGKSKGKKAGKKKGTASASKNIKAPQTADVVMSLIS